MRSTFAARSTNGSRTCSAIVSQRMSASRRSTASGEPLERVVRVPARKEHVLDPAVQGHRLLDEALVVAADSGLVDPDVDPTLTIRD